MNHRDFVHPTGVLAGLALASACALGCAPPRPDRGSSESEGAVAAENAAAAPAPSASASASASAPGSAAAERGADADSADSAEIAAALRDAAERARALLGERASALLLPWDSPARQRWHYTPRRREGVTLGDMNDEQSAATRALLATLLSDEGRAKVDGIVTIEGVLGRVEGNPGFRDPGRYALALFGEPSPDAPWGWRFEGHHLSLNVTQVGDGVATTPAFFGANPARVRSGPHKGLRVLAAEEDAARALFGSLSDAQWLRARIAPEAPFDLVTGNDSKVRLKRAQGLPASELSAEQTLLLRALLEVYTGNLRPALARAHMQRIERAGLGELRIAWAGSLKPGRSHYYRVHGPTHLIEYDNRGGNHIHSVFRDLEDDFGEDLLARHLREHPHPAASHNQPEQQP